VAQAPAPVATSAPTQAAPQPSTAAQVDLLGLGKPSRSRGVGGMCDSRVSDFRIPSRAVTFMTTATVMYNMGTGCGPMLQCVGHVNICLPLGGPVSVRFWAE